MPQTVSGQCGGNTTKQMQDFMTFASKAELSARVLGSDRIARGRANCSIKTHVLEVPLFDGIGEAWRLYASRLRNRGGFTAIDPRTCSKNQAACAAVQKALERDPTLTFVNGRFVPAHSLTPPLPPPPPTPPPLFSIYNIPPPPPFPPTPSPPPPWYAISEVCIPVVTAAESDTVVTEGIERAVCVYVRSIQDERVTAQKCFAPISPSPPPPPPVPTSRLSAISGSLLARRVRQGGTNNAEPAVPVDSFEAYKQETALKQQHQIQYLEQLSTDNFQLRDILGPIIDKIEGRRLWQRVVAHASHQLEDNILASTSFGNAPIMGVTTAECSALCDAIDNTNNGTCVAIAYARLNADPTDLTLRQCYLLRGIGGCTPGSFAGAVFARRDTDPCTAPTESNNPLCIQLASARTDLRILTFDETVSVCRHGKGKPKVAHPQTVLEAFSYLGYARERGVHSFWSDKPAEGGLMVWSGLDGQRLNITAGERRCVLVTTVDTSIHGHMFAELRPCAARLADGVVCESAEAARTLALNPFQLLRISYDWCCIGSCCCVHSTATAGWHGALPTTATTTATHCGDGVSSILCAHHHQAVDRGHLPRRAHRCGHLQIVPLVCHRPCQAATFGDRLVIYADVPRHVLAQLRGVVGARSGRLLRLSRSRVCRLAMPHLFSQRVPGRDARPNTTSRRYRVWTREPKPATGTLANPTSATTASSSTTACGRSRPTAPQGRRDATVRRLSSGNVPSVPCGESRGGQGARTLAKHRDQSRGV